MYVGVDIGGTNIRVAVSASPRAGFILKKIAFLDGPDYEQNHLAIVRAIRQLTSKPTAIGIAMPGRLSEDKTTITHSLMVTQWIDKPIVRNLIDEFHCPVIMERDQYCSSLAEALVTRPKLPFCRIGYGSGIGAAWVTYHQNQPQIRTVSNEIHAAYIRPWQEACAGYWLVRSHRKSPADFSEAEWNAVMQEFGVYFNKFVTAFPSDRFVFGGGMAVKQWSRLSVVLRHLHLQAVDFRLAYYEEEDGLIGALALLDTNQQITQL